MLACRYMDSRAIYGMTPLHIAVMRQDSACVRALLEAGADFTIRSAGESELPPPGVGSLPFGSTCLHLAALCANVGIIQALLQVRCSRCSRAWI